MLQVLRLRISHIAHRVPYFLKEPALSVFLLNEIHMKTFLPYMGTIRRRLKNVKISEAFDVHTDRQSI